MIKNGDNLESTKSKMGPFADDLNRNDNFYLTKGQLISECLFSAFNFPKKTTQKFDESIKWSNQKDKGTLLC